MPLERNLIVLFSLVSTLSATLLLAVQPSYPQNKSTAAEGLTRQLIDRLNDSDKTTVLVMDLETPEGQWSPFGAWLADQFSSTLASMGQQLEVVDRTKLMSALSLQRLSPKDEFDLKNAISLSKSVGASTLIMGSFGAAKDGIGVTLVGFRVSEYGVTQSTRFSIGRVNGRIPLTREVAGHLNVSLDSLRPKDGIYKPGIGGVSVPSCIKCPPPDRMSSPNIDLTGLLREKRHGGTVVLQFVVTAEGHTTQVTVAEPLGYGIDEQYVNAISGWEFKPAVDADNKPVPVHSQAAFHINFK